MGALDLRTIDTGEQVEALQQWQLEMERKWLISTVATLIVGLFLVMAVIKIFVSRIRQ